MVEQSNVDGELIATYIGNQDKKVTKCTIDSAKYPSFTTTRV